MQSLNQETIKPIKGFILSGSRNNKTAYIDPTNKYEICVGGFVMPDDTSRMKGLVVKKVGGQQNELANIIKKAIGVVVANSKTNSHLGSGGDNAVTISLFGSGTKIYLEAKSAFSKGDELEIDVDKGLHKVKKKTSGNKIGIALEEAKADKDIVLVQI